jgi:NHL repeat-containing protein/WD40 repeat protein
VIASTDGRDDRRSRDGRDSSRLPLPRRAPIVASGSGRRVRSGSLALFSLLLLALLLGSTSALAATPREHVFRFSFGGQGAGEGTFSHPSGIAVNSSTGDVYVSDRANSLVEEFKPTLSEGELAGEEYVTQFAVPLAGAIAVDNCASESASCSEDPSAGDVYVAGAKNTKSNEAADVLLYKFSAAGTPVGTPLKFKHGIEGVAVDASGNVFVYQEGGAIVKLSNAEVNVAEKKGVQAKVTGEAKPGLAVNSLGNFYVGAKLSEAEAGGDAAVKSLIEEVKHEHEFLDLGGLAPPTIAEVEGATGNVLIPELDYEPSTAVAVNPVDTPANGVNEQNDVYVVNLVTVGGEQLTAVAEFGPEPEPAEGEVGERHGKLIQRFVAPGLSEGNAIAVNTQSGSVYVADPASEKVDVFNLEPRGHIAAGGVAAVASCTDEASGKPCPAASSVMTLKGQVNSAGVSTHDYFEYGSGSCAASACTKTPATDAAEAFGGQEASVQLQGLPPGIYHYRLTVENSSGTVHSAEQVFTIVATQSGLPDGRAWEMVSPPRKGGAEPEAITKEGGLIQAAANGNAITYVADGPIPAEANPEGNRNPEHTQVLSARGGEGWFSQNLTTPNATGAGVSPGHAPEYQFFSTDLALALVDPYYSVPGSLARPPLSPLLAGEETGTQENTIYLGAESPLKAEHSGEEAENYERALQNGALMEPANRGFLALVTKANEPGPEFGESLEKAGIVPDGATSDLSHVVFASERAAPGLYEWGGAERESKLRLVTELPEGQRVGGEGVVGLGGAGGGIRSDADARNAISSDGSLVVWTYKTPASELHLYVRDTQTDQTLQLDKLQAGEGEPEESTHDPADAVFQTASTDGKRVFFTDTQRLTSNSRAVEGSPDLYVFETSTAGGNVTGSLTDLTPQDGAHLLVRNKRAGGVLGASNDGAYVYFVANGALTSDATRGHCDPEAGFRPPRTTCNLYVRHYNGTTWEPTKLIAALSSEDLPDWGGGQSEGDLSYMTSRVSPNGNYLAFMSNRSLTGYDNEDVNSKKPGERLDEEVYLYKASPEGLTCASCDPTGARPRGVADVGRVTNAGGGEGLGLIVDRRETWSSIEHEDQRAHWLAGSIPGWTGLDNSRGLYQSRYLSDNGRLFFNSADALVPLAVPTRNEKVEGQELQVGVENVYEYQPTGEGGCGSEGGCVALISSGTSPHESAFLDASTGGNDVFFLTAAQLAPQDVDTNFDVYDARVCGATCPSPPPPPPSPCVGEACQGPAPTQPNFSAPASTVASPLGNVVGQVQVLGQSQAAKPKPKPLTPAQELAKALKTCGKDKQKSKRLVCEQQARKKYRASMLASALKACRKDTQASKRVACEKQAKKKYAAPQAKKSAVKGKS